LTPPVAVDPVSELSASGVTSPVTVAGLRWLRARVQATEASPTVVNVTIWAGNYPLVLDASSGAVLKSDYTPNSILWATAAGAPNPMFVAEQSLVGRMTGGSINDLTASNVKTILLYDADDVTFTPTTAQHWLAGADPGSVGDALDALAQQSFNQWPAMREGFWWSGAAHGMQRTWSDSWTTTLTADRVYVAPFYFPWACRITDIVVRVATGQAGANGKIVLYDMDDTPDWTGGNLLLTGAELDFSSTGSKQISSLTTEINQGWYWLGVHNKTTSVAISGYYRTSQRIARWGQVKGGSSYASIYGSQAYGSGPPDPFVYAGGGSTSYAPAMEVKVEAI